MKQGKTEDGELSPAKPALIVSEPLSTMMGLCLGREGFKTAFMLLEGCVWM